ncbi:hypothetical protein MHB43_23815 [Paenibacillus sp. FSL H8-0317]|uniref:hypothetical protein n=1 Tax=Paenibacillus sp. FSL H8-0317 TaxID=2921385 RepID=UPI0032477A8C
MLVGYIKKISFMLALVLALNTLLITSSVSANEIKIQEVTQEDIEILTYEEYASKYGGDEIQPQGVVVGVVVFIAGIVVAWIVDGVLIHATGHSGGEWVAKALSYQKEVPTCTNIYFSKATSKPICHSGSSGSFSTDLYK